MGLRERLERLEKALGTPWERLGHGNALGTPWERADVDRVHYRTVFPHYQSWEHLGNGLTVNEYNVGRCTHIGNTVGTG